MTRHAPSPTSFLILSDIHFGSSAEFCDFAMEDQYDANGITDTTPVKTEITRAIAGSHLDIDAILVPGDLTSTASPREFEACVGIVNDMARTLNVERSNVFYTFGNHDTDWRIASLGDHPYAIQPQYEILAGNAGSTFVINPQPYFQGPLPGCGWWERENFNLLSLNTGYYCTRNQNIPHGKIGTEQLTWVQNLLSNPVSREKWTVLMLHHHPSVYSFPQPTLDISALEEGPELLDLLGRSGIDIVCHGHRHHPKHKTTIEHTWRSAITFLSAGSVAVSHAERMNGKIPNMFHVVRLEDRMPNESAAGAIWSFSYEIDHWQPSEFSPTVPLDPIQRFGSVSDDETISRLVLDIIDTAIGSNNERHFDLPLFNNLDRSLQHMPHAMLNQKITNYAEIRGFVVVGGYPNVTVLRRI